MAIGPSVDAKIYVGQYNLSGLSNQATMTLGRELHDVSVFDDASRTRTGGLYTASMSAAGFWEAGGSGTEDAGSGYLGVAGVPWTLCPASATAGALAYVVSGIVGEFTPLNAPHGMPMPFTISGEGASVTFGRGMVLGNASATGTGNGTACQVGALTASQRMVCALHVLSVSGTSPSMTIKVQSDDNSGFTSATDRATFTAATAAGYEVKTIAGAITDDYWRYSISAFSGSSTPTVTFLLSIGIGPA